MSVTNHDDSWFGVFRLTNRECLFVTRLHMMQVNKKNSGGWGGGVLFDYWSNHSSFFTLFVC